MLSTEFGKRATAEAVQQVAPSDYDDFIAEAQEIFAGLRAARLATSEDVAQMIFDAASDGTDCWRYVTTPDIEPLFKARRETSEDRYIAMMRSMFLRAR